MFDDFFVESISIVVILLLIMITFIRRKRMDYAISCIALMVVPFGNTLALMTAKYIEKPFANVTSTDVILIINIISLIASCLIAGFSAGNIKSKKSRAIYFIMVGLFAGILSCIFIFNALTSPV